MIRNIVQHPSKMLRKRSIETSLTAKLHQQQVQDAIDTVASIGGSGISLVQIGVPIRVIVLNCQGGRAVTLVNPRIIAMGPGKIIARETCVSTPGRWTRCERYSHVWVQHLRPSGLEVLDAEDPEVAVALQHEIDHLNGVMPFDRAVRDQPTWN